MLYIFLPIRYTSIPRQLTSGVVSLTVLRQWITMNRDKQFCKGIVCEAGTMWSIVKVTCIVWPLFALFPVNCSHPQSKDRTPVERGWRDWSFVCFYSRVPVSVIERKPGDILVDFARLIGLRPHTPPPPRNSTPSLINVGIKFRVQGFLLVTDVCQPIYR